MSSILRTPRLIVSLAVAVLLGASAALFSIQASQHAMSKATTHAAEVIQATTVDVSLPPAPPGVHVTAAQALQTADGWFKAHDNGRLPRLLGVALVAGSQLQRQSGDITQYPRFIWVIKVVGPINAPVGGFPLFDLYISGVNGAISGWHGHTATEP